VNDLEPESTEVLTILTPEVAIETEQTLVLEHYNFHADVFLFPKTDQLSLSALLLLP
jgi:hypothetical protein